MNLPKEYSSNLDISCYQIFMWNKLAKQDEILLRKKNNEVFGRLFVQCFANRLPIASDRLKWRGLFCQM